MLKLLNDALATEIVCTLRYKRHHFMAKGINSEAVAAEFAQHATEEQEHADRIAERIVQLGGEPDFAPDGLKTRAHRSTRKATDLTDMIRENLVAERIAIDTYREIIRYLGEKDVTTRRLFEEISQSRKSMRTTWRTCSQGRDGRHPECAAPDTAYAT